MEINLYNHFGLKEITCVIERKLDRKYIFAIQPLREIWGEFMHCDYTWFYIFHEIVYANFYTKKIYIYFNWGIFFLIDVLKVLNRVFDECKFKSLIEMPMIRTSYTES